MPKVYSKNSSSPSSANSADCIKIIIPVNKKEISDVLKSLSDKDMSTGVWALSIFTQELNNTVNATLEYGEK